MPDVATQTQDEWGGCAAAALTDRLNTDHNRELDEQLSLFKQAQRKQSPFAHAVEEVECLIDLMRTHNSVVEAALAPVREAYPVVRSEYSTEGLVYVHSDGTPIDKATIAADQRVGHLHTTHRTLCEDVEKLRKHAMVVARRKPGARGAVLPPRVATRVKMLLTVALPSILKDALTDSYRRHNEYVTRHYHFRVSKRLTAARELCDSLMAALWDESLIMPLQPPAKRRRTAVAQ